jgi:hypothetical protein
MATKQLMIGAKQNTSGATEISGFTFARRAYVTANTMHSAPIAPSAPPSSDSIEPLVLYPGSLGTLCVKIQASGTITPRMKYAIPMNKNARIDALGPPSSLRPCATVVTYAPHDNAAPATKNSQVCFMRRRIVRLPGGDNKP